MRRLPESALLRGAGSAPPGIPRKHSGERADRSLSPGDYLQALPRERAVLFSHESLECEEFHPNIHRPQMWSSMGDLRFLLPWKRRVVIRAGTDFKVSVWEERGKPRGDLPVGCLLNIHYSLPCLKGKEIPQLRGLGSFNSTPRFRHQPIKESEFPSRGDRWAW